jgi:hypothetical protein
VLEAKAQPQHPTNMGICRMQRQRSA